MTNHKNNLSGIMSVLKDKISLPDTPENLSHAYKTAKPFPHLIIDNLFPSSQLDDLAAEMRPLTTDHWVHEDSEHLKKINLRSAVDLGDSGFHHTSFLHSAGFLYLLSLLSGIGNCCQILIFRARDITLDRKAESSMCPWPAIRRTRPA